MHAAAQHVLSDARSHAVQWNILLLLQMPWCLVYNVYGPTEATITATSLPCPPSVEFVSIGRPVYNMHSYVVNSSLHPVPVGVPGELLLSGPRLAIGYAGRPDLTTAAFVPNPCLDLVAGRVDPALVPYYAKAYRTGDLVRWRSDGNIEFLGRIDRQVKITGVRIELGEVEAALEGAEGVAQAVATALPDSSGQKRLVGYVVPGSIVPASVVAHCRSVLIPAMVPSVVVALDAFPLLPNGKVDVRSLPSPDWAGAGSEEYVGPANDTEAAVQRVFADVLRRPAEELSVLADFFAAGGTSLQVFRAAALLQEVLGIESVPATLVHTQRTTRCVATALGKLLAEGRDGASSAPIEAREWPDATRPLSANQEQMWLLSTLAGASAYNMPGAFELERAPDAAALQAALDAVAARHEVLRTRFKRQRDGGVAGVVIPASEFRVPLEVVEAASEDEVMQRVAAEAVRAFDLEAEPLLHVCVLVRPAPAVGAVLSVTMHHAVGDAWSQSVFWRELSDAYGAATRGAVPSWQPLPIQYADYAAWQHSQLSGESGAALRTFWREYLSGAPSMVQLPQDRPRPQKPTFEAGTVRTTLPSGLLPKLEAVAQQLRVNVQAVLLAGLQAVLLRYSGQDDLVIGVPVAGRDRPETHGLVGYFVNTLPVRCLASEDATFADMVRDASKATLAALDHALLPFEEVVAVAGVARVPNVNPSFQVLFQYMPGLQGAQGKGAFGDISLEAYSSETRLAQAKMDLTTMVAGEGVSFEYMAELFDESSVARLMRSFISTLDALAGDLDASALSGSLLGPTDTVEILRFSMGEERPEYLGALLVHEAFAAVASRSPERRCLCYEGEWLSYGEVAARVDAFAGRLAGLGVGPGMVVGLMLDRSFELVVSMMAVLKAGGCYLPCDPSYPDDRLAVYLEDGKAAVVLAQHQHSERAQTMVGSGVPVVNVTQLAVGNVASVVSLRPAGPEDPAYIIFTSGSTGRPKGVMVPHRGLRDLMPWLVDKFSLSKSLGPYLDQMDDTHDICF